MLKVLRNYWILSFFFLSSCAGLRSLKEKSLLPVYEDNYSLSDKAGQYQVKRKSFYNKSKNAYVTKVRTYPFDSTTELIEGSLIVSNPGFLNKNIRILRPLASKFETWFDKKKYSNELRVNFKSKSLDVSLNSPEKKWSSKTSYPFPKNASLFCFFSQLAECAAITGFTRKATVKKAGTMNLYVIWDGFPYIQEIYPDLPREVFSKARLEYDGQKNGHSRFSLYVANQVLFYLINKSGKLIDLFWVSQGYTLTKEK